MKFLKKKNKGILGALVVAISSLCFLAGCGSSNVKDVPVKDINEKITSSVNISEMRPGDKGKFEKLYNIDLNKVEEFVLYTAPSNIKVDEIAIVKSKDEKNVDDIKGKIEKRVETQGNNFKDYLPKEYSLIENKVLKTKGKYVLLVISKDAEKIEKVFDESFK